MNMGLNNTPIANRIHISFFGRRNAGKSSVVNAITEQDLAVVSNVKGTTTDPVYKSMEILPIGPVVIIDTPGIDDEGELGEKRIGKTNQILNKTDIAILVMDISEKISEHEILLMKKFNERKMDYIVVFNKIDLIEKDKEKIFIENFIKEYNIKHTMLVSAINNTNIFELKEAISKIKQVSDERFNIIGDILKPLDVVVLVIPIDSSAPKGRLILPQQQVIRDVLEAGAISVVVREHEYKDCLKKLVLPPKLVITDSQVFEKINKETDSNVFLTSFSILMARYKGVLFEAVKGAKKIDELIDGDKILISEGCTHHRQCEDIGTVKLPKWIEEYTGKKFDYSFTSGGEFADNISDYKLVIHCGGCMLNDKEMKFRQNHTVSKNVSYTNYGILIAYMNNILERTISML